jgi:hypothetical protein
MRGCLGMRGTSVVWDVLLKVDEGVLVSDELDGLWSCWCDFV